MYLYKGFTYSILGLLLMTDMLNLAFLFGTRPEIIKIAPIYQALRKRTSHKVTLLSTGQHQDQADDQFGIFNIKPDVNLNLMKRDQQWISFLHRAIPRIEKELLELKPDCLFIQGDTVSTLSGAIVANSLKIPLAYVESGLRTHTEKEPFPEEMNRVLISKMADFNFSPTEKSRQNLIREGIKGESIFVTGNTIVDSIKNAGVEKCQNYLFNRKVLITLHRQDSMIYLKGIAMELAKFAQLHQNLDFIFPLHKNPKIRKLIMPTLDSINNVTLMEPVNYLEMLNLIKESLFVVSDSGGIQEEATSLGIPVAIARDNTERIEGVELGVSMLMGRKQDVFQKNLCYFFEKISQGRISFSENPYGDGHASERIINVIHESYGLCKV
ncbi:UDP-N-acetylglucosamine 2-epimerase (non-hydrolyzing) [bacterium]|nr:UDP-N-acetylglucosamine 2-epimerase (non-hydrolyzing) [bacterium]|tara:strand:+ start:14115 stop:15263 length:1149 start_codon:yes stop_codon:yes gene_type:complete